MPARNIATANISFGLVSVPVQIFSSSESKASVSFNMLHKKCGSRVKQQYICPKDNDEVVARDEMVKGYEFAKDQYVVLTAEEIKALEEKGTGTIDVQEFVPLDKVDREYLEKVYYLGPDKGGERAYRLLAAALLETGKAAIGQYAARGRQYLILLRPKDGRIVMEQLHYADELRATTEVDVPEGDLKPMELTLAKQLIEQTSTDSFEPAKYKDVVRERMLGEIEKKVAGQEITMSEKPAESSGKIIDLMEALKASLASQSTSSEPPKEAKKKGRKAS
ncbi:MAG TPA: Ku protein [Gemmatimonadaceae bacterium]|nr:Ku protein [Gemmatimonadaceae bacterium]